MLQVVIPMAGTGSRFMDYGFHEHKYLLPVNAKLQPMIELAISSLDISVPCKFIYIIREDNGVKNNELRTILDSISNTYNLSYVIHAISHLTEGPASTVYEAKHLLDPELPLLVSNSDQILDWNFKEFFQTCQSYDGCVLTYTLNGSLVIGNNDKHSFIRLNDENQVVECKEKIVLSKNALVGVHYFKTTRTFLDAYDYMYATSLRAPNGEFYLSLSYQAMIEKGLKIGYYDIQTCKGTFYPVGEPEDYFAYLYRKGNYSNNLSNLKDKTILMETDSIRITYEVYGANIRIKNEGLLMMVSGFADVDGFCLNDNDITNYDIMTHTVSSIISIWYKDHSLKEKHIWNTSEFTKGWFIGNFVHCILSTNEFEVGNIHYKKDAQYKYSYYIETIEYNVLLSGSMILNGQILELGTCFTNYPKQMICPIFLEDCQILSIKMPIVPMNKDC